MVIKPIDRSVMSNMSEGYKTVFDRGNEISSIVDTLGDSTVCQIFVHSVRSLGNIAELAVALPGFEKYDERALVAARPDDIVCVAAKVDNNYLKFLASLGIGPKSRNVIAASESPLHDSDVSLSDLWMSNFDAVREIGKLVKQNTRIVLNPYIISQEELKLAAFLEKALLRKVFLLGGTPDIIDYVNHKHNVKAEALKIGVPVPEGDAVELQLQEDGKPVDITPIEVAINRYIHNTGRAIVRGSYGYSGSSTIKVENKPESIQKALLNVAQRTDNSVYLVEVMLDLIASPNIIMYIEPNNGRILFVSVTDQILNDTLAHQGNIYPSQAKTIKDMIKSAWRMSNWLQMHGYCGYVGFDFGEYINKETGQLDFFLAEINPRINAANYPKCVMEYLNRKQRQKGGPYIKAFLSRKIPTKVGSFLELRKLYGHLFFNPETAKGSIPYNIGCLKYGSFALACFGQSREEVEELYDDFKELLERE